MTQALTRERLHGLPRRRLHSGRNRFKAVVDLIDHAGTRSVLKDVAPRSWLVRLLLGPWQLSREERAYRHLQNLPGIPRFLARVDRQAIALEYIEGPPLQGMRRGALDDAFFDRLEALVRAMHARGVAHGDLHHGDVLAGPGGTPFIVDFSTSCIADPGSSPPRRWIFRQLQKADHRAVAKLRYRLATAGGPEPPPRAGIYRLVGGFRALLGR